MHKGKSILQGVVFIGYLLPITDFQALQYMTRSIKYKEYNSYINRVQNVTMKSQLKDYFQRQKHSNLKCWYRGENRIPFKRKKQKSLKSVDVYSDRLNVTIDREKGLKIDLYI